MEMKELERVRLESNGFNKVDAVEVTKETTRECKRDCKRPYKKPKNCDAGYCSHALLWHPFRLEIARISKACMFCFIFFI